MPGRKQAEGRQPGPAQAAGPPAAFGLVGPVARADRLRLLGRGLGRLSLGLFRACKALLALGLQQIALFAAAMLLPPFLFLAGSPPRFTPRPAAWAAPPKRFQGAAEHLFSADESVAGTAARLGRAVRRELDALNARPGRRLQPVARAGDVAGKSDRGAGRSGRPRRGARRSHCRAPDPGKPAAGNTSSHLTDSASRAAEIVTGQSAQLKSVIDRAEDSLRDTALELSGRFIEAAARATDVVADRSVQLKSTIDNSEQTLRETAQELSGHFIEAAARATDVMTDRSVQLKTTIDHSERSLRVTAQSFSDHMVEAASRATQTLSGRSNQLKSTIDGAEASLRTMAQSLTDRFTDAASNATELVAGRAAQLNAAIETAEGSLKMAGQSLDVQAAGFRAAAQAAADAPHDGGGRTRQPGQENRRGLRCRPGARRIRAGAAGKASRRHDRNAGAS